MLLLLPQFPQDPASGAARSMTTMAEMAAAAGYEVRALATTATEGASISESVFRGNAERTLRQLGNAFRTEGHLLSYRRKGVSYRLLDTNNMGPHEWHETHLGKQFDALYDQELYSFDPDIILTYGGHPFDVRRRKKARLRGTRVIFGLRNFGYLQPPGQIQQIDAILAASRYLADRYRAEAGVQSVALPLPIDERDTVAESRGASYVVAVNPSDEKGVMPLARILEEVSVKRPDIEFLIVQSRGTAANLVYSGMAGGFNLQRHANIRVIGPLGLPKEIFVHARMLLVPSVWDEPAGRVVAEAMLNGIPVLLSDRKGLKEIANEGGVVLPLPADLTPETTVPPSALSVRAWTDWIIAMTDDTDLYQNAIQLAKAAGQIYHWDVTAPQYLRFFDNVLAKRGATP